MKRDADETAGAPRAADRSGAARQGRLTARPHATETTLRPGLHRLAGTEAEEALLYVPRNARGDRALQLVLMLHGAGGGPRHGLAPLLPLAEEAGLVLLAPKSRGATWDVLVASYGPDVAFVDRMLARTFERCAVDPARIAIEGFSDGASYALSLGLTNGDLFDAVIAFSPGFSAPAARRGSPRIYISHGVADAVLRIDRTSRRIVPDLENRGYEVRYSEFAGPHTVPENIAREAVAWLEGAPQE